MARSVTPAGPGGVQHAVDVQQPHGTNVLATVVEEGHDESVAYGTPLTG
jgi:hypothetical protein